MSGPDQLRDWNAGNLLGDHYARAGDTSRALAQYKLVADQLFGEGHYPRAAAIYKKALRLEQNDEQTLLRLADIAAHQGMLVDARSHYRRVAELRGARGDERGARDCLKKLGAIDPASLSPLDAARQAVEKRPDDPQLLLYLARIELQESQPTARATVMRLLTVAPSRHADVLGLCETIAAAGRIDDAYACLDVAVDVALLEGDNKRAAAALEMLLRYAPHPDALARLAALQDDEVEVAAAAPAPAPVPPPVDEEIDLSDFLAELEQSLLSSPAAAAGVPAPGGEPKDLEEVFDGLRTRAVRDQEASGAGEHYKRGMDALARRDFDAAIAEFRSAARAPLFRFNAALQLARLHVGLGDLAAGVEWYERAADVPSPLPDEGYALLYELGDALEQMGESSRALAVLIELDAEAPGYRDVHARVERLALSLAEGRQA